jgi:hypothetical protein
MGTNSSSQGSTRDAQGSTKAANPAKKRWTIMLYISADDVLANFAVESLRQLNQSVSAAAEPGDTAELSVAAQFAYPPATARISATGTAPGFYIFKEEKGGQVLRLSQKLASTPKTVSAAKTASTPEKANMSQKEVLQGFLNEVYKNPQYKADHYALILWGHGPELLLQPGASNPTGDRRMYLTPEALGDVLRKSLNGRQLDIVAFDACFMSMFEMAYELKGLAKYMVASQDEVPDASFPYGDLVKLFRRYGNGPLPSLLEDGLKAYVGAYADCICNVNTGMRPVTLSVLDLENSDDLKDAVTSLACALLKAKSEAGLADLLMEARKSSRDYATGLYVDLHDFCTKLSGLLNQPDAEKRWKEIQGGCRKEIQGACGKVLKALTKGKSKKLILDNSDEKNGGGISIYLPYLTDPQFDQMNRPLVKGGPETHTGKGFGQVINGAATEYLMCARRELILDTESYYDDLSSAKATHWYSFITDVWTDVLIKTAPADLDYYYSAQQGWMNASRAPIDAAKIC